MSEIEIIDATKLLEFTQEGIATENFAKAKEWIVNNVDTMLDEKIDIIGIKNPNTNQIYYWGKNKVAEFKGVLNKLEGLYNKRKV